jgi:hypothetical protein
MEFMIANRTHTWSAIQFDKRLHAGFNRRLMNYLGGGGTGLNFRKSADERESTEGSPECQSGSVDGNILFPAIVLISASSSGFRRRETRVEATRRSPKRLRQCPIDLMATTGPYARCCSKRF